MKKVKVKEEYFIDLLDKNKGSVREEREEPVLLFWIKVQSGLQKTTYGPKEPTKEPTIRKSKGGKNCV